MAKPEPKAAPPPEPNKAEAAVQQAPPVEAPRVSVVAAKSNSARFRVWAHGALRCDGVRFAPGEELPLSEEQVLALNLGPVAERIVEG